MWSISLVGLKKKSDIWNRYNRWLRAQKNRDSQAVKKQIESFVREDKKTPPLSASPSPVCARGV